MRVAVLGAGGTVGPALVRDLAESAEVETIEALDLRRQRAAAVVAEHGAGKATAGTVDARDPQALTLALDGVDVLVNAAAYRTNLLAMDAALAARCAYVDLGGLYHVTLRQLQREVDFEEAGLVAVLGAGAAPGKTNVMAARAAAGLEEVLAIRCASAGLDEQPPEGLSTPYALRTLLDEVTLPPVVFEHGDAALRGRHAADQPRRRVVLVPPRARAPRPRPPSRAGRGRRRAAPRAGAAVAAHVVGAAR